MLTKNFPDEYRKHNDLFISFNDRATENDLLTIAYKMGFSFPNGWRPSAYDAWDYFDKYAHGNAKPILHFFFNSITGKNEINLTYREVIKSYPQYKSFTVYSVC